MRRPGSMRGLEDLGRVRLSPNFFLRDFLYSEIADFYGIPNLPETPDLAIEVGRRLCQELLEPLQATFGRIAVRSGYRAPEVNAFGNKTGGQCASNAANAAYHIWDHLDAKGHMGAGACIVIPWFADRYADGEDWRSLAWYLHDKLPYSHLQFFPKLAAFNIQWHEHPIRRIDSFIAPRGCLTKPGMANNGGNHGDWYRGFPALKTPAGVGFGVGTQGYGGSDGT
ncbi:MAG: hypothetical protein AAF495_13530 [Pseudomonadota bacterium]